MSRILVVDDSLTIRMDLAGAFEAAGLETVTCATLAEARAALVRERFALIVLDVLLPDGDGVELLGEIRRRASEPRDYVVMLSTEAEVHDRVRGMTSGADEYLAKPYEVAYLVERARDLVRGPAPARPVRTTILVIDDSATFRGVVGDALGAAGYDVAFAESGEAGLRLAASLHPTAIVVDGVLPGIDGPTVIRRLRLDVALRATPCILLTGSGAREDELTALDAGADGFVHKDADLHVLLARLAAILRGAASSTQRAGGPPVHAPKKVLAVDDSSTYLHELATILRAEGYEVVLARSGEEALELLSVQPVDCILLDVVMPGLGGRETCERIKASPTLRDTPLILLTGLDDRAAMIDGLLAGADDYISKSSELDVLRARVRAQIRRRQIETEARRIREELMRSEREVSEARAAKELADTRAALADELARKNRELEAFSYSVSHDLRAPLRSIDGFSDALLEEYGDRLDDTGRGYLMRVRAAARRMGELIDDLLELSKVDRTELRRQRVDVTSLSRRVGEVLARAHADRSVELVVHPGLVAEVDPRLLEILLENLLGNAWKFTAKVETARIEVGRTEIEGQTVFFVRDNGAGFDPRYSARLFTPFQRLHASTEFAGTGIGLATVSRIVERHGGRAWAEGAVGAGATIFWTTPPPKDRGIWNG